MPETIDKRSTGKDENGFRAEVQRAINAGGGCSWCLRCERMSKGALDTVSASLSLRQRAAIAAVQGCEISLPCALPAGGAAAVLRSHSCYFDWASQGLEFNRSIALLCRPSQAHKSRNMLCWCLSNLGAPREVCDAPPSAARQQPSSGTAADRALPSTPAALGGAATVTTNRSLIGRVVLGMITGCARDAPFASPCAVRIRAIEGALGRDVRLHRWPPATPSSVRCARRDQLPWASVPRPKDPLVTRAHQTVWEAVRNDPDVDGALVLEEDALVASPRVGLAVRATLRALRADVTFLGWSYLEHEWNASDPLMPLTSHAYVIMRRAAGVALRLTWPCLGPIDWQLRALAPSRLTWATAADEWHVGVRTRRNRPHLRWSGLFDQG